MSTVPPGIVCTAEEYALSLSTDDNPYPTITCLTHGQNIGVLVSQ